MTTAHIAIRKLYKNTTDKPEISVREIRIS